MTIIKIIAIIILFFILNEVKNNNSLMFFTTWFTLLSILFIMGQDYNLIFENLLPTVTIGSILVFIGYIVILYGNPELEYNISKKFNINYNIIILRSIILHVLPLFYFYYLTKISGIKNISSSLYIFVLILFYLLYNFENPYNIYGIYRYKNITFIIYLFLCSKLFFLRFIFFTQDVDPSLPKKYSLKLLSIPITLNFFFKKNSTAEEPTNPLDPVTIQIFMILSYFYITYLPY